MGGSDNDGLVARLLDQATATGVPALWLDVGPAVAQPFDLAAVLPAPTCAWAEDLESEANAAALAVLEALARGDTPVALIAQDRLVVRRIRALLERAGVSLADETGWTLSTTRAAAHVMTWLGAATLGAGRDALIEAMKLEAASDAAALEDAWRHERAPPPLALHAVKSLQQRFVAFRGPGRRRLREWTHALAASAPACLATLDADPAGRAVLATLRLDGSGGSAAWQAAAADTMLDLAGFVAWVDASLEAASFVAPAPTQAEVIITPLVRAALRRFGAVVFPGCDDRHLGASRAEPTLIPEAVARTFELPCAAKRRARETWAFAQLLRVPRLHLLHRTHDADEALTLSPLVELAWHARARASQCRRAWPWFCPSPRSSAKFSRGRRRRWRPACHRASRLRPSRPFAPAPIGSSPVSRWALARPRNWRRGLTRATTAVGCTPCCIASTVSAMARRTALSC